MYVVPAKYNNMALNSGYVDLMHCTGFSVHTCKRAVEPIQELLGPPCVES